MAVLPDPAASQALLVGVHAYDRLENLPAVERNLTGLQQTLTDRAVWGLPPSHCTVLSQPPSTQAVLDTLGRVAQCATDTLVVYYAGHGITDPVTDELYLGLPGSDPQRTYSALPYEWVRRAMLDPQVRARRKVMILDCCYSGRALLGGMSGATEVADHALIEGTCLLAASSATRKSLSPPRERYTAFTGELITLLAEGLADGPSLLDMETIYRHLYITLAAKGRPLPQQRNRNTGGLVALARNRAHFSYAAPPPAVRPPQPSERPRSAQPEPPRPHPAEPRPMAAPESGQSAPASSSPSAKAPAEAAQRTSPAAVREAAQDSTPLVGPVAVSVPERPGGRSVRAKVTAAAIVGLLAVGIPVALVWLPLLSDNAKKGTGSSVGVPAYNAAATGVVNASKTSGGTLKFVSDRDADSWDPQRTYYGYVWDFARYYTRQLVTYAPEPGAKSTRLVGDLATSTAEITDGGRTYRYRLRAGVTWQDGSAVTSKDVKYGIERLWAQDTINGGPTYLPDVLDPDHTYRGPYKDTSESGLKAIRTPDDHTVVFTLTKPNADFEQMLAMTAASPVKSEKDTTERYGLNPFSDGPYRFASYSPGKSLVLVRNSHWSKHSDPVRAALPDKITVDILLSDTEAIDNGLLDGTYDLELSPSGLSASARQKAISDPLLKKYLDDLSTGVIRYAAFPQSVRPMDNIHCRKAVIYAADHKALQTAFGGPTGGDIAPSLLPPGVVGAESTYDPYSLLKNDGKPDTARAKAELSACGRPKGFSTTIGVRSDRKSEVAAATVLQASLREVGIRADIAQVDSTQDSATFGAPAQVQAKGYGIILTGWAADFPSLLGFWPPLVDSRLIVPSGNFNRSEIKAAAIDKLLGEVQTATGSDRIAALSRQINHKVSEGAYHLPLIYEKRLVWRGSRLTNVYSSAVYSNYDYASLGVTGS